MPFISSRFFAFVPVALLCASACSSDSKTAAPGGPPPTTDAGPTPFDPDAPGPYPVGAAYFEVTYEGRTLPSEVWYPAVDSARAEEATGHGLAELEPAGARHDVLAGLVASAPDSCVRKTVHVALDATPATAASPWPLLAFSHCHGCARFSEAVVAERLASWGFVVVAPDHVGNTIWEQEDGTIVQITGEFLQTRGKDVRALLDVALGAGTGLPAGLVGHLDADRVGMFGHSYGSVTTGLVLQDDVRVKVGVMMAAPPENPLIPGVSVAKLTKPGMFFLAEEDNSITALGNQLIHQNFDAYPAEARLVSVKDAGHWSFSDMAGLTDGQKPGCGSAQRQTDPNVSFTYLDNDVGRTIAARYVTTFFQAELAGDATAKAALDVAKPADIVTLSSRP